MEALTITTETGTRVSVDAYDNWDTPSGRDNVWLNLAVPMSSTSVVLTPAQAQKLAAALIAFAGAA
jgi:hypothetical protein